MFDRKEVVQNLERILKSLNDIEKSKTKIAEKSQKKASNRTECPITIQILQRQKRRRRNQNIEQIAKIEEKLLKNKYSDKGLAFFGSVSNLIK